MVKNIIWWEIEPNHTQIDQDLDEFTSSTEKFYKIAMDRFAWVDSLENGEDIMVFAINYIDRAHAIPPMRGEFIWFDEILHALLEICQPNTRLDESSIGFLDYLEQGIAKSRQNFKSNEP